MSTHNLELFQKQINKKKIIKEGQKENEKEKKIITGLKKISYSLLQRIAKKK